MSEGDLLRGWVAGSEGRDAWFAKVGVIHGARLAAEDDAVQQSRLVYQRPLQNGESISYEFQYEPGQLEAHPALGRIALLIEPEGVRLHWITNGDREWIGLAEDNAVVEPLNRRGQKPLQLVAGQWNRVTLALENDTLTLSLNDAAIYVREMETDSERTFGFYHDQTRSEVRVRNVVMRGDWPERLTDEQLNGLTVVSKPDRSIADRRVLGAIFDDQHVHGSVLAVHRRAMKLPSDARYAFLSAWVLPSPDHQTLRLALDFSPSNPAPSVSDEVPATASGQSRVTKGGDLISPALDLVAVAKEIGKLDELRERVAATPLADEQQRRSRLSMLSLVDIGRGDLVSASVMLDELAAIVAASPKFSFLERWPETLAIREAARFAETREAAREMANEILERQIRKSLPSGNEAWNSHVRALAGRVRYFDLRDGDRGSAGASIERFSGQSPLANWVPASQETTRTRGQGFPRSRWELSSPATVEKFASHEDDYLFYRIPLRGNFEVACDVSGFGWREASLWVAGRWVAPVYTHAAYDIGDFRFGQRVPLDPPLNKTIEWIRYRAVVRDGVCTTYLNGRRIHERALATEHDPWIAIRGPYSTAGAVRNLRITGQPEIPIEVKLDQEADLPGWLPMNHGHLVGPNRKWQHLAEPTHGGGIRGISWYAHPGADQEALLRYHRPMVEDGTIEYEFHYRAGAMHVHPALDRLALMLEPGGVRVHWITDCEFDRTELTPNNQHDEPANRRGAETLPLRPNAWNRLQLSLTRHTVHLKLNDELVYERELEPTNQRTFGLFHYADRTEARVRNIV